MVLLTGKEVWLNWNNFKNIVDAISKSYDKTDEINFLNYKISIGQP